MSILVNFSNFFHANLTELELNRKGTELGNFIKGPIHFLKKENKKFERELFAKNSDKRNILGYSFYEYKWLRIFQVKSNRNS